MGHVVRDAGWCVIDIDTTAGRVFLQQGWKYDWKTKGAVTAWTLKEKRRFHKRADDTIWAAWSNRARLSVSGTSGFAKKFGRRGLPNNLDIRWVLTSPHWNVQVTKIAPGAFERSEVKWKIRKILLDTNDFDKRVHCAGPAKKQVCHSQVPLAHEFGHAVGNTWVLKRGDEYKSGSSHLADKGSMLNSGSTLRSRHFRTVIEQLNKMIPNTTFKVRSL